MTELENIKNYLLQQKFHLDYKDNEEEVWISYHRGETVLINNINNTATISQPFDIDREFNTLSEFQLELN